MNIHTYIYIYKYYEKISENTSVTLRVGEILLNQDAKKAKITKMVNLTTSKFKSFIYQKIP